LAALPLTSLPRAQSFQTSVVRSSYSPRWSCAFDFSCPPAAPGGRSQALLVSLLHYNTLTPNRPIGTASIDLCGHIAGAAVGQAKLLTLALRPLPLVEDPVRAGPPSMRAVIGQDGQRAEVEVRVTFLGLGEDGDEEPVGGDCWSLCRTRPLVWGDDPHLPKVPVARCRPAIHAHTHKLALIPRGVKAGILRLHDSIQVQL
jgi:hypothetical protein